jgi:hypothetical protein
MSIVNTNAPVCEDCEDCDYQFYQIKPINEDIKSVYVGKTKRNIDKRFQEHINSVNKGSNRKIYKFIRENGGSSNFKILLIESKEKLKPIEANKIEEYHRQNLNADLNSIKCYMSPDERNKWKQLKITCDCKGQYRQDNKVHHLATKKHIKYLEKK